LLAGESDFSSSDLIDLAQSKDAKVRATVALRADLPLGMMISLSNDPKSNVRAALASSSGVSRAATVVSRLLEDKDADVVAALAANPTVSVEIVRLIASDGPRAARKVATGRLAVAV